MQVACSNATNAVNPLFRDQSRSYSNSLLGFYTLTSETAAVSSRKTRVIKLIKKEELHTIAQHLKHTFYSALKKLLLLSLIVVGPLYVTECSEYFMCVCVRVCLCACVFVCLCACVRV